MILKSPHDPYLEFECSKSLAMFSRDDFFLTSKTVFAFL